MNFGDIGALDNGMAYKNKCSDLPKDRERYGTFPIFGETKNEYGAPAPAGKANARFLEKQKQNKCNVAILHSSKHIGGRKAAETLQYRILSDLQLLPSARTKASVRFSTLIITFAHMFINAFESRAKIGETKTPRRAKYTPRCFLRMVSRAYV